MNAVPKLRFPEFDGEWKTQVLGDFLERISNRVPADTELPVFSSSRGGLKPQDDYFDGRRLDNLGEYGVVPSNSITYRHMSDDLTFKFNLNDFGYPIAVSKEYPVFATVNMDERYLIYWLNFSDQFKKFAILQKLGGTRTRLYFKNLEQWQCPIPSLPEQQKIASFISAVDKKNDLLRQKKDALEVYKKGLMQKIFSQEFRFKQDDGSDFPDWEEVTLGDYSRFLITNSLSRSDLDTDGVVQNIHYGDIHTRFSCHYDQCSEATPYISDTKIAAKLHKGNQLQRGDIVIADASEDYADIGKAIEIVRISDTPLFSGLHTIAMRPDSNKFAVGFGSYLFQSTEVRRQIHRLAQGAKVLGLSKGNIQSLTVSLPCVDEQKKIAEFISALDRQSNRLVHIIEHIETFKKGLLQQMFV